MEKTNFTPEQSLLLISKTIEETKERVKEYGHIFVFWGTLTVIVFGSQYILGLLKFYEYMMYPVYLFPVGAVITGIWVWMEKKKNNAPKTIITNMLQNIGWVIGINLMIMGFFFRDVLGDATAPVFIILLAIMMIVSGLSIKFKALTIGGLLLNLIGLGSFLIDRDYHGFSIMAAAVLGMIVPGILLNIARRKENV